MCLHRLLRSRVTQSMKLHLLHPLPPAKKKKPTGTTKSRGIPYPSRHSLLGGMDGERNGETRVGVAFFGEAPFWSRVPVAARPSLLQCKGAQVLTCQSLARRLVVSPCVIWVDGMEAGKREV